MTTPSIEKCPWGMKIVLPLGVMFAALLVLDVVGKILGEAFGGSRGALYYSIYSVAQNVLAFVLPAIASAYYFTRKPYQALRCDGRVSWKAVAMAAGMFVVSLPMMNWLVAWNNALSLPESMSAVESALRSAENSALAVTDCMIQGNTLPGMLAMVLVMGVLTGLGEEFFFRGAILGGLIDHPLKRHLAVWLVAALFSFMHFQVFGFVPRMLMGVWLGYLFVWSGSIWVPVIYHALNNSMVVVTTYLDEQQLLSADKMNALGVDTPWLAVASLCAVLRWAIATQRLLTKQTI